MLLDDHVWMFMPPTAILSVLTFTAYFAYRIYCLVIAQQTIQPANALGLAWFFLAVEILTFAPTQLPLLLRSIAFHRPKRPQLRLEWHQPEDVPTVDIIITCCGEDLDVLLDTVRATCNIDYPPERYRVFLSDDGASEQLRTAIESLEVIGPKVIYTTREKPAIKDYKAGNLNHGLKFSRALPNQSWRVDITRAEKSSGSSPPSKKSSAATLVGSETDEMPMPIAKALSPGVYEGMAQWRWWEENRPTTSARSPARRARSALAQSWRVSAILPEELFDLSRKSSAAALVGSDADGMSEPITKALPSTVHVGSDADEMPKPFAKALPSTVHEGRNLPTTSPPPKHRARSALDQLSRMGATCAEGPSGPSASSKPSDTTLMASDADGMPRIFAETLPSSLHELEDTSVLLLASEYIVGIDADMIPERCILRALLPHMVNDATMAMACPPQTFYDCPPNDPLIQTMHQFSGVTEIVHDSLGHADCLGSGYIMRRAAVEDVGGFPTESLSEDVCCSARLLGAGWKTCFIPESLQHGSVPESYNAHVKQRTRWFVGHVQTAIMFKFRLFGAVGKHLTWRQRAVGMSFDLKHAIQAPLALLYLALPFTLFCGYPFVMWSDTQQLKILIRLVSVHMLCRWAHQLVIALIARRVNKTFDVRLPSYDTDLEQFLSPYIFVAYVRSFILPAKLGGRKTGFTSTGSIASAMDERSKENRASLPRRVWIVVVHQMAWIHLLFILAITAGVTLTLLRCFLPDGLERIRSAYIIGNATTPRDKLIYLITRLGWPPLFWLQSAVSALTPFVYAISPPTVPNREELLDRDPKTGIAYPKESSKVLHRTKLGSWRYWRGGVVILYTWALLVGSAWL